MSERLYDYTLQRENGGSQNLYWGNHSKKITAEELEQMYNADDNARLRESFGSFDNYFAYMNERQDLIDSGDYKADWWNTGQPLVDVEGLGRQGGSDDRALEWDIMQEGARQGEIGYNEQADVFNNLYEKYTGESTTKYLDNGSKYEWNGSSFVMTQEAFGPHIGSMLGNALPGIVLTAGMAGPLGGMLGNATGSSALGKGLAAGLASAGGQYVSTGSVDPASVLASGVVAGLNPGGMLAKELEGAIGNSFNPDSFGYGFVSGGGNNVVNQLISNGELDLGTALQAGLISGGINSVRDTFDDSDYYTQEEIAKRYLAQGYTADDAWRMAGQDPMLNTTDLGALVGEGGLLSVVPRVPIGFIKGIEGLLTGTNAFYATLPDGTKIPYSVLEAQGPYKFQTEFVDGYGDTITTEYIGDGYDRMMELDATFNDNPGSWEGAGLLNNPITRTVLGPITGLLPSGDSSLTEQHQAIYDQYKTEAEVLYGPGFKLNGKELTDVQRQSLINDYAQSKYNQYWAFWHGTDGLDENYTVAPNPRGDSELLGATFAGYDENGDIKWTTGTRNWTTDADGNIITTTLAVINPSEITAGSSTTTGYTPDPNLVFYVGGEGSGQTLPSNSTYQDYQNFLLTNAILGDGDDDKKTVAGTDAGASTDSNGGDATVSTDNTGGGDTDDVSNTGGNGGNGGDDIVGGNGNDDKVLAGAGNPEGLFNDTLGTLGAYFPEGARDKELGGTTDEDLPAGGDGSTTLPDANFGGQSGDGLPPLWSELYGYTKLTPYKGARLKILNDIVGSLDGEGMMTPKIVNEPYMKLNRDLVDAGILA